MSAYQFIQQDVFPILLTTHATSRICRLSELYAEKARLEDEFSNVVVVLSTQEDHIESRSTAAVSAVEFSFATFVMEELGDF